MKIKNVWNRNAIKICLSSGNMSCYDKRKIESIDAGETYKWGTILHICFPPIDKLLILALHFSLKVKNIDRHQNHRRPERSRGHFIADKQFSNDHIKFEYFLLRHRDVLKLLFTLLFHSLLFSLLYTFSR